MAKEKVPYYVHAIKQDDDLGENIDSYAAVPRIMLASLDTKEFVNKIALGLLNIWNSKDISTVPFSVGPSYENLDKYRAASGRRTYTLDSFYQDESELAYLLTHYTESQDLALLIADENYYDTCLPYSNSWTEQREIPHGSPADLAEKTNTPVLLVVNLSNFSFTSLSKISGILDFRNDQQIAGFILVGDNKYDLEEAADLIESEFDIPVFGCFADKPSNEGPSLYRVIPQLAKDTWEKNLEDVSQAVIESLDINKILRLARRAQDLDDEFPQDLFQAQKLIGFSNEKFNLAVARDQAFNEYYQENIDILEEMGANIIYFSPLIDPILPSKVDGIYLGSGNIQEYIGQLSKNESLRTQIRRLAGQGMPILAEGAGAIYLAESYVSRQGAVWPLVGVLPTQASNNESKTKRFYAKLNSRREDLLGKSNNTIRCLMSNEYILDPEGASYRALIKGEGHSMKVFSTSTVWASQARLHFYALPSGIAKFALTCMRKYMMDQ